MHPAQGYHKEDPAPSGLRPRRSPSTTMPAALPGNSGPARASSRRSRCSARPRRAHRLRIPVPSAGFDRPRRQTLQPCDRRRPRSEDFLDCARDRRGRAPGSPAIRFAVPRRYDRGNVPTAPAWDRSWRRQSAPATSTARQVVRRTAPCCPTQPVCSSSTSGASDRLTVDILAPNVDLAEQHGTP